MTARKRGLARCAWTAFLVLFATWAIAGASLCELHRAYGPVASRASAVQTQALHGVIEANKRESESPTNQPSHERDDNVCEAPVYLSSEPASPSTIKRLLTVDAIPWSHAPAHNWAPAVVMASASPPQWVYPPPSRSPLDISPRLRI
jgi:hypothetical protein